MFGDIARAIGGVIGFATGSILGVASTVIATTLGITAEMVDEALKAGCETYEDIKDFHRL